MLSYGSCPRWVSGHVLRQVLWCPPTSQKHSTRWIGSDKKKCEWVYEWRSIRGLFPSHSQSFRNGLWKKSGNVSASFLFTVFLKILVALKHFEMARVWKLLCYTNCSSSPQYYSCSLSHSFSRSPLLSLSPSLFLALSPSISLSLILFLAPSLMPFSCFLFLALSPSLFLSLALSLTLFLALLFFLLSFSHSLTLFFVLSLPLCVCVQNSKPLVQHWVLGQILAWDPDSVLSFLFYFSQKEIPG